MSGWAILLWKCTACRHLIRPLCHRAFKTVYARESYFQRFVTYTVYDLSIYRKAVRHIWKTIFLQISELWPLVRTCNNQVSCASGVILVTSTIVFRIGHVTLLWRLERTFGAALTLCATRKYCMSMGKRKWQHYFNSVRHRIDRIHISQLIEDTVQYHIP